MLNKHHVRVKVDRIIASCTTQEQLSVAANYIDLASRLYGGKFFTSARTAWNNKVMDLLESSN